MTAWHELLANLAIVALSTSIWTFGNRRLAALPDVGRSLVLGFVMAAGTFLAMLLPFQFTTGVLLDFRYTFLAIAGFFGGPVAAALPFVVSIIRRLMSGGVGVWIAVPHILAATTSGLVGYWLLKGRIPDTKAILLLSFAVALSGTFGFFVALPASVWANATMNVVLPFGSILLLSCAISGLAMAQELKRQLVANENRTYRAIIEALPDCLNAKDVNGRFIAANPATAELMGASDAATLIGKTDFDYYPPETAREFRLHEKDLLFARKPMTIEQRFVRANGREAWLSTLKAPFYDEDGILVGMITHNREITEQKRLENDLAQAQRRLADAISSMADGLAMFDRNGNLVFHNQRYLDLFPKTADVRTFGAALRDIIRTSLERGEEQSVSERPENTAERIFDALTTPGDRQTQLADGRWIAARTRLVDDGGCMIVFSDITNEKDAEVQLRALNAKLAALANTDGLTGLHNRRAFDAALDRSVKASSDGAELGLLMIDVDRFKAYNDTYGHPAGDECLKRVAACIGSALAGVAGNIVARYGGEEIAVILPHAGAAEATALGRLLCIAVRDLQMTHIGSEKGIVTVSVGAAALSLTDMGRKSDLLRRADEGLYMAKAAGRDCVRAADVHTAKDEAQA